MSSRSKVGAAIDSAHKRLMQFAKEHPEFAQAAQEAIRPWERNEELLLGAIGPALLAMYEHGRAGRDLSKIFLQPTAKPVEEELEEDLDDEQDDDDGGEEQPVLSDLQRRLQARLAAAPKAVPKRRRRG